MIKIFAAILIFGFVLVPATGNAECTGGCLESLYEAFDYWMKNYNHHGNSHSKSFSHFPSYDIAILYHDADYKDYKALSKLAKKRGYKIDWLIGEGGFYTQKNIIKRSMLECR